MNPIQLYDKINNKIFKNNEEYIIKTNISDIVLSDKFKNNLNEGSKEKNDDESFF